VKKRRTSIVGVLVMLVAGYAQPQSLPDHRILNNAAEPLQTRFNQDFGKVRLVLLLSPT
jgi:hypothetical protein